MIKKLRRIALRITKYKYYLYLKANGKIADGTKKVGEKNDLE